MAKQKEEQRKLYIESVDAEDGNTCTAYHDAVAMGYDFELDNESDLEVDVYVFSHKAVIRKRVTVEAVK